jgi:hypothetical protein
MGSNNVVSTYYPNVEDGMYNGNVNVECLHSTVYKQFLGKIPLLLGKYVEIKTYPKSLEGAFGPTKELKEKWGYNDLTKVIVGTTETIGNQSTKPLSNLTKKDIVAIVAHENMKLKGEIQTEMTFLKHTITNEAKSYKKNE